MNSFQLDLSGYYTYTSSSSSEDDGYSSFKLTALANGVIYGSGSDKPGPFVLSGALIDDDIRFVKLYTNSSTTWKYIGKRLPGDFGNVYQFTGAWGAVNSDRQDGQWVFTGVATGTTVPKHPTGAPPATLDSALKDAAASHNQGISSTSILALSQGFKS
ncbi:hypothetical protein BJ165DRAFT_1598998 [Panaeolus papilionaceus]|nr:hypothetical protein BJ165DRAFT_1598998 [Panaeolus papilionaceus]